MDEDLRHIEELFHSALDDNEEIPSPNVWETVEKQLDQNTVISIKRKYNNLKRVAFILMLLLCSSILYDVYIISHSNNNYKFVKGRYKYDTGKQPNVNKLVDKLKDRVPGTIREAKSAKIDTFISFDYETLHQIPTKEHGLIKNWTTRQMPGLKNDNIADRQLRRDLKTDDILIVERLKSAANQQENPIAESNNFNNEISTYNKQLLVQSIYDHHNNQTSFLRELRNISIEKVKMIQHDSIKTNKLFQLIVLSTSNNTITSNKIIETVINRNAVKPTRFSINPFFSPDIAWYRLRDDNVINQTDNSSELEKEEKHEFSSTFGAMVNYNINRHWAIQSGVTLSNINITVEPKTIYAQQDNTGNIKYRISTSSGYGYVLPSYSAFPVVGDSLYVFTSTHSLQYIGVPLAVTYAITNGKFKFNAMGGLSANILSKAKLETTVEKGFNSSVETVDNLQGLRKVYFSGLTGIGVDYKLNNITAFTFAPTMRFALNSINNNTPVKSYPMSFGFMLGLKIAL